jgi:hypothetical protein
MWTVASMPFKISREQAQVVTVPTSRAVIDPMPGKREDQAQGLAEQSLNTSIVHPDQGGRAEQGERSAGHRSLTGNDQRKGLEKTDADAPEARKSSRS